MRNFHVSRRTTVGGNQLSGSHICRIEKFVPHNSILVPPSPSFKRSHFLQTLIDIGALIFGALFVSLTGIGVGFALFVLFNIPL